MTLSLLFPEITSDVTSAHEETGTNISVVKLNGETVLEIPFNSSMTILTLMKKLEAVTSISIDKQKLYFKGKELKVCVKP